MNLDKRREPRRDADGIVRVRFKDPRSIQIEGRLLDLSPGGFRMSHDFVSLTAGQVVEFSHDEAKGRARVMWNRVLEARVETGFLVVSP
jgi:hypothetical protein